MVSEPSSFLYSMRALAFLLILLAIVDKNLFAADGSVVGRILRRK